MPICRIHPRLYRRWWMHGAEVRKSCAPCVVHARKPGFAESGLTFFMQFSASLLTTRSKPIPAPSGCLVRRPYQRSMLCPNETVTFQAFALGLAFRRPTCSTTVRSVRLASHSKICGDYSATLWTGSSASHTSLSAPSPTLVCSSLSSVFRQRYSIPCGEFSVSKQHPLVIRRLSRSFCSWVEYS